MPLTIRSQRVAHHFGVRVADGDVSLAQCSPCRPSWPGRGQLGLDDEVADLALQLLDPVHGAHPAPAHATQVRRPAA